MDRPSQTTAISKESIVQGISSLTNSIFSFWQRFGFDAEHGGFHGTLDQAGAAVTPTSKGLVQQARHLWAFSTYHLHGYASMDGGDKRLPTAEVMAQSAHSFLVQHMKGSSDGLWHWNVTREGQLLQSQQVLYGLFFILYGFSQYYTAFNDTSAKDLAFKTFTAMDKWYSPEYGGYTESAENGFPSESLVDTTTQSTASGQLRTLNVILHGTEALTALHKATGDPTVLLRLLDLLELFCVRLQRSNGLVFEGYAPAAGKAPWTPAPNTTINYGHNLEATWLALETLDYLQAINAIEHELAQSYRSAAIAVGEAAVRGGYDQQHGGIFEYGSATGGPDSKVKVWWIQAEAMLALWKLYEWHEEAKSGSSQLYLQMLADTVRFVQEHVTDTEGPGEQFWQVDADGTFKPSGDINKDTKGNRWKASYHNSRAVLFLKKWMTAVKPA